MSDTQSVAKGSARRPKAKRGDDARGRILEAGLAIFASTGFEGATMREIARAADVTHPLALYHFGSKEELWLAIMDRLLKDYETVIDLEQIASAEQPAWDSLQHFFEKFVYFSARNPQLHRILTMEGGQDSERLRLLVDRHQKPVLDIVRDLIRRGQREGSVRDGDPIRLFYYVIGAAGTLFTLPVEYKILSGRDVSEPSEIHHAIAFILDIIRRPADEPKR